MARQSVCRRCALAALLALAGAAQDAAELEVDHNVHSRLVTPHTAWARPYARGTLRVLFFLRGHDTEPREVVEFAQRFDLEPQMVFWTRTIDSTEEGWHGGDAGVRRLARLLTEPWDAFVFMAPGNAGGRAVTPDMLPAEQQMALIGAVTQGAGLVLLGVDDPRVLKEKNRLAEPPAFLGEVEGATAFTVLKGRGVRLAGQPKIPYRLGWDVEHDEWALRVGKAILWAAGKEPPLELTLQPTAREIPRSALPGPGVTLTWAGTTKGQVKADLVLRREDGVPLALPPQGLATASGSAVLQFPALRAGAYYLDVIARQAKAVVGFGSVPVTITSERRVEGLSLDQDWAEIGGALAGNVRLIGPVGVGESLAVALFDRRGRELVRQTLPADSAETAFRFAVMPWFPMLLEVRATLVDGANEVASAWQLAHVVKRHRGRFNFIMWDSPRGNLAPWAEQSLANSGISVHLAYGTPPPFFAAYEMAWIPYTTHLGASCKPACWADEAAIQPVVDEIVTKHVPARQRGVFVYSLGDEIVVRGSCLSPACLAAYRRYLREQYQDIAALNASWGSSYASFDEVQLSQPEDNHEAGALRSGNFPRWFDRQAYQSWNFCQLCERFGRGFRSIDPESRCGFEGAGTFGNADDIDGFVRSNTFWSPYPGTADELLRSIAPRGFPHANWMGYTKDPDTLLEKYWRMVTRGCDAVWWWRWDALGRFHGWLSPNLDPFPAVQELLRDTQIVRDGLGDLLLDSALQTDAIGILYSLPSGYAAKVQGSPTFGSYEADHAACHALLRELGLNFQYFTDRQMRLGEVDLSRFRVVFLPLTQALAPTEAGTLRAYVRQGGTLIADVRPGIYDGHVKPLPAGQLDEVFGVKRTGFGEAAIADATVAVPRAGGEAESLSLRQVRADGGIEAAGATAAGSAGPIPLFLSHGFGQGRAVLLNLPLSSVPALNVDDSPEAVAHLWRQLLAQAQVSAAVELRAAGGRRLRNVETTRWLNGPVQVVSVFRHAGDAETASLHLPQARHVYDLKAGKALGRRQVVELTLTPYRAQFFALSPEPLAAVELRAVRKVSRGTVQRVTLTSALPEGRQAVRVRVELPDGQAADWLPQVVMAGREGATLDVPVALNDPRGTWTVHATELYTGKSTRESFKVE